jgi:hypothetical protein
MLLICSICMLLRVSELEMHAPESSRNGSAQGALCGLYSFVVAARVQTYTSCSAHGASVRSVSAALRSDHTHS